MKKPHSEFFDKLKRNGAKSCLHIGFGISKKFGIVVNCGYAVFRPFLKNLSAFICPVLEKVSVSVVSVRSPSYRDREKSRLP